MIPSRYMFHFLKHLFSQPNNSTEVVYLHLVECTGASTSFILHFYDLQQQKQMLLELMRLEHNKDFLIQTVCIEDELAINIFNHKTDTVGTYRLIELILEMESEIKQNGEND